MADYNYRALKSKPKTLLAMTGLTAPEFEKMNLCFQVAWEAGLVAAGRSVDERRGCPGKLDLTEDKLLFILFYLKTYPLQEVLGYSFGLSQGVANQWIHRLCPVLQSTLEDMGHAPTRVSEELLSRLDHELGQTVGIDGTERRIQRSLDPEIQRAHYSGKKKPILSRTTSL